MSKKKKYISTLEAQAIAKSFGIIITVPTIIAHIDNYGHQVGGKGSKYFIDDERFRRFINGEKTTRKPVKRNRNTK
jgi:hypothetical protein